MPRVEVHAHCTLVETSETWYSVAVVVYTVVRQLALVMKNLTCKRCWQEFVHCGTLEQRRFSIGVRLFKGLRTNWLTKEGCPVRTCGDVPLQRANATLSWRATADEWR